MRILVATDAWHPQVNGVVTTYGRLAAEVEALGGEMVFLTPDHFRTFACPGYPEIRLAWPSPERARAIMDDASADYIHIATEGPVGWMARSYCLARGRAFTTSYHTKFPEYAAALLSVPASWAYAPLKRFHRRSAGIMVATPSLAREMATRGFEQLLPWTRGVDTTLFRPREVRLFGSAPVFLSAGRISKEKNIEAFLDADLPGRKVVVGDGPHLACLRRRYPDATFTGLETGEDLARCYASADVFVFPSRTDTFGLVLLEALASGLPVAAYPVTGPIDIVEQGRSGVLANDLGAAARAALSLDRATARERALDFTWRRTAEIFLENVRSANARAAAVPSGTAARLLASRPRGSDAARLVVGERS
jgi:glycosyltransferase involved in cell wall biosynthesis